MIRKAALLLFRLALVSIAMAIAYILSTVVMGQADIELTPEEASRAAMALPLVSVINALALSYPIARSRWHGLKLIAAVLLVQFGVETFMTQMETLYFNAAVQMGGAELAGMVAGGALRALIFAPLAVLIWGKMRKTAHAGGSARTTTRAEWGKRFAALSVLYFVVYFSFGYFVAWQWAEARLFYSGTTAIKPFLTHFRDLFRTDPAIIPFQILRGALWTSLAAVIVGMIDARRWQASLAVALVFTALMASGIGLFPNPYMPPMVRQAHFYELLSSMLVYGGIAGWVVYGKADQASRLRA